MNQIDIEELQSQWEQSTDANRPSWPTYLASMGDGSFVHDVYFMDAIDNYDPSPWCHQCGAMTRSQCDCGPIADNN
jgi:hypothetical protein